jgi:hypothetical protein
MGIVILERLLGGVASLADARRRVKPARPARTLGGRPIGG